MIKLKKVNLLLLYLTVLAGLLVGCSAAKDHINENLLGIRQPDSDKLLITITCHSQLEHFAAAVEERFPDIRLVQDSYMGKFRISEHIARIENNDLGDIVMVKAGHIPKADLSERLLDLSTQAFPGNYNTNVLQADEDGHISLIPGPLSFNCNMYNKTLFEENHWTVPGSYEELLELCKTIDRTGIRGFRNAYFDSGTQSYQIYQYSVFSALDTLTQVEGQIWHGRLMAGEKVSLAPMETAFADMRRMMDAGALRPEDLDVAFDRNLEAVLERKVAITAGEIDHLQMLNQNGTDEFGFMPHFSMTDGEGWLLNLGYYFGANQELLKPGNEKKLEAAMEIMNFIASEEGQKYLIEDGLGMVPSTRGAEIPDNPEFEHIRTQIESGHYIMRPGYDMFTSVLMTEIAAFIRGETDSKEIIDQCSVILEQGMPAEPAFGEAEEDFTVLQTGLLKADALREATGTDVALIGMAEADCYTPVGGTRSRLYQGPVTEGDIIRVAQIQVDIPIMSVEASVSGEELLAILEYGATSEEEQKNGVVSHYHPFAVSGLNFSCRLDGEEGNRVSEVRMKDGSKLQPDSTYTISFLKGTFPETQVKGTETGITMTDALQDYIIAKETITPDKKRIQLK